MNEHAHHASTPSGADEVDLIMERVAKIYANRPEDAEVKAGIDRMIRKVQRGPEGRAVLLVGPSGAGKSTMLYRILVRHSHLQFGLGADAERRVLYVEVPGPCTLVGLGCEILTCLGYPYSGAPRADVVWRRARQLLRREGVRYIHFDEIQNVTDTANVIEAQKLRDTLKSLMLTTSRIGLIMSGQPSIASFLQQDTQVKRRTLFLEIRALSMPQDAAKLDDIVTAMAAAAGLRLMEGTRERLAPRLSHAAEHQLGSAVEFTHRAIEQALRRPEPGDMQAEARASLTMRHFADSYAAYTGNAAIANPFISPDWASLDASKRLVTRPEQLLRDPEPTKPRRRR